MIEVIDNPLLLDYVKVLIELPPDEIAQIEDMTGHQFDVDGAAVGCWSVKGPKWSIRWAGVPLVVGGFHELRPKVWQDFLLTTPKAWTEHWFPITRICRKIMDSMLSTGAAHRLECVVPTARVSSRPELVKWYKVLGYNHEATLHKYCVSGADAEIFSRVA
jgi:hypothetical protein